MIPYKVVPMFELGPLHINMYGIMFALGFLIAAWLAVKEAKKKGVDEEAVESIVLYILIGSIIGARVFYVVFYWPAGIPFSGWDLFKVWEGGLAFFGGFIGALIAGFIYVRKHGLDFWKFADLLSFPLVVGHILGRLGDYLTGAHPGKVTQVPWAIYLDGALRHPVVLYEILGLVIIGTIIYHLRRLKKFDGFIFLAYVQLYAVQRMILDFFRIDSTDPRFFGLTPSQYFVILLFVLALCSVLVMRGKPDSRKKVGPNE